MLAFLSKYVIYKLIKNFMVSLWLTQHRHYIFMILMPFIVILVNQDYAFYKDYNLGSEWQ